MRKKIATALVLVVCVLSFIGIANATMNQSESERAMQNAGETLRDAAQNVINDTENHNSTQSEGQIVAVVNGRNVSAAEMNIKIQMYALSEQDANAAWAGMKLIAMEESFAREHGLMPTGSEIMQYAQQLRSECEELQESYDHVAALASGLGMSLDEYWYEYRTVYEIPTLMVRERVNAYIEANNLEALDVANAEYTIRNSAFFQSKGISVDEVQ